MNYNDSSIVYYRCVKNDATAQFYLLLYIKIIKILKLIKLFRFSGNKNTSRGEQMDQKSDQWFGATLSSVGVNGPVVVSPKFLNMQHIIEIYSVVTFKVHKNLLICGILSILLRR